MSMPPIAPASLPATLSLNTRYCPELTVAAVVRRDDTFLTIEEVVHSTPVLNQPSGHVERGEDPLDAVVRETLEESGYRIRPVGLIGGYLWQSPRGTEYFRLAYEAELIDTTPSKPLEASTLDVMWMRRDALDAASERLRTPLVLQVVDDFIARGSVDVDRHRLWMPNHTRP